MSHEGIRIVPQQAEPEAEARERPELTSAAIAPVSVRVHQTEGTGVEIEWKDGHRSQWTFPWLRDACPCATCVEEREASGREPGQPKAKPATALPMYTAPALPNKVRPVGRYAVSFDWNDGHTSGIYSWHYLRSVCQCEQCRRSAD